MKFWEQVALSGRGTSYEVRGTSGSFKWENRSGIEAGVFLGLLNPFKHLPSRAAH